MSSPAPVVPAGFQARDIDYLTKRAIDPDFAASSGVRRLGDHELRDELNFGVSLTNTERGLAMTGLYFPTRNPITGAETTGIWRPDIPLPDRKYLRRKGDKNTVFFPHVTTADRLSDPKTEIWIAESPAKSLSLAQAFETIGERAITIGLNGVNGGWSRKKNDDGRSVGVARLNEDLDGIPWNGRRVYLCFDNDISRKKHALAFSKSAYAGAIGAEYQLARLLRARGAEAWIVELPFAGVKKGIDDILYENIQHVRGKPDLILRKYRSLIGQMRGVRVSERDTRAILARPEAGSLTVVRAADLAKENVEQIEELVGNTLLVREGITLLSAPAKFGKSVVCLNLASSLETGTSFLEMFPTTKSRVLYVNYELPKPMMIERVRALALKETIVFSPDPGSYALNSQRQKMTGVERLEENAFYLAEIDRAVRENDIDVVMFDPLGLAIDGVENDPLVMRSVVDNLHTIARRNKVAVLLVHHNRKPKTGEHFIDTASGHSSLVRYVDNVISGALSAAGSLYRFRLDFALRCSAVDPLELHWRHPKECLQLYAAPWKEGGVNAGRSSELLGMFSPGDSVTSQEVQKRLGIGNDAVSKLMGGLVSEGKARKVQRGLWVIQGSGDATRG